MYVCLKLKVNLKSSMSKSVLEINLIVLSHYVNFVYIDVFVLCFLVNCVYDYCMINLLETKN
jgi:hypothetical protein